MIYNIQKIRQALSDVRILSPGFLYQSRIDYNGRVQGRSCQKHKMNMYRFCQIQECIPIYLQKYIQLIGRMWPYLSCEI